MPGGWSAKGRFRCPRDLITLAARSVTPPTQSYSTYFTLKRIASRNLTVRTGAAGPLQRSTGSELHECRTRPAFLAARTRYGRRRPDHHRCNEPLYSSTTLRKRQGYAVVPIRDYLFRRNLPQLSQVVISVGETYRSCHLLNCWDYLCWRSLSQLSQVVISEEKLDAVATYLTTPGVIV